MAITNCLNFGNPRKPAVFYQLREAIAGMGEACTVLGTPVTGGNVSLYNENPSGAVYPTPVVGMVGVIDSLAHVTPSAFQAPGDTILLLGETRDELGGSEYLATIHGVVAGRPPECDLSCERDAIDALLESISGGHVTSAHDVSDGGLAVALAECCIAQRESQTGASADLGDLGNVPSRSGLFGESQARFIVSSSSPEHIEKIARRHGVPVARIGHVSARENGFSLKAGDVLIESDIDSLSSAWHDAIPSIMSSPAAAVAEPVLAGV